ncbi:DUF305 domain-containing protein [Legionella jordanis]|uniref:DUF305 domain-containing protein n=1 Tax=Legionella jordanis TaxID=456 RepID=UPI002180742F|nr:DUF305 domain-containing protein [Legionella jordanis]
MMMRTLFFLSFLAFGIAGPTYSAEQPMSGSSMDMQKSEPCACMKKMMDGSMDNEMMNKMMMKELGNKDAQYDKRFIDLMIPHHEAAILMAQNALKNSDKPEIKTMAQNIITAQEKEIAQLKEWRKQWYGQ